MRHLLVLSLFILSFAGSAEEKWVMVENDRQLYTKYYYQDPRQPTVVLLNGLTQDTQHWRGVLPGLIASGLNVLTYDIAYQGRTFEAIVDKTKKEWPPRPVIEPLLPQERDTLKGEPWFKLPSIETQAADLKQVLQAHHLARHKVILVGLSYGGALALQFAADYPERVRDVMLVSPYTEPLAEQDELVAYLMKAFRRNFPQNDIEDEVLYDYILRNLVLNTYHLSEPSILKWGIFQPYAAAEMIRGVRKINARKLVRKVPAHSLHLVIAEKDQYINPGVLDKFWQAVPTKMRGSKTNFKRVEHKVNESAGPSLASWIVTLAKNSNTLKNGRTWALDPLKGYAQSPHSRQVIPIEPSTICENLLLTQEGMPNQASDRVLRNPLELWVHSWASILPASWRDNWRALLSSY